MINLYGIHNLMKERFTAYAALLIYPPAVPSMHYEAVPIHITALTIDGAGEFLIDAVSTMGTYHPAIPIQRVCMSKHGAALCATRLNMEHHLVKDTICLYHGKNPSTLNVWNNWSHPFHTTTKTCMNSLSTKTPYTAGAVSTNRTFRRTIRSC